MPDSPAIQPSFFMQTPSLLKRRTIFRVLQVLLILSAARAFSAESAYSGGVTVTPLLQTQTDGAGQKLVYPAGTPAEITGVLVVIAPGRQTNWHHHPVPCVAYILEGELSVELAGGQRRILKAGEAFAEAVGVLHNGTNLGSKPVRLVLFALGTAGQPYAVKDSPAR